ncbi:MAG: uroporphyrinogen decarboxylase family protein [Thermodesulfobacteriota bacterium]
MRDTFPNTPCIEALWNRQKPEKVPLMFMAIGFSGLNVGYTIGDMYTDLQKRIDSKRWTSEQYGWYPTQTVSFSGTSFPAEEFGGQIKPPNSEYSQAPMVIRYAVEKEEDIYKLKVPDHLEKLGAIPKMLEGVAYAMKFDGLVFGPNCYGPMDSAGAVIGIEKTCRWMIKKPELIHHAFRIFTDFKVALAKLYADLFGPERLIPQVGGPSHSNQIISPRQFEQFCLPYIRELHDKLREMGYKHFFFHCCGEQNANLPFWAKCEMGDPGIISVGHEIDLLKVAEYFPKDIAFGNLEPAIIQIGPPEKVYEISKEIILKGKNIPGGFIFSAGCELPPKAPPYNVWMMTKAVNDFGWYDH